MSRDDLPTDTDEPPVDPERAWIDFQDAVDRANGLTEEVEAAEELADLLAAYIVKSDDPSEAKVDSLLARAAQTVDMTKTKLVEHHESTVADIEDEGERYRLEDLIEEKLERVVVSRSTDHNTDTTYQWYFRAPDVVLETRGEHRDPQQFRNMYFDAAGQVARHPRTGVWYDWIDQFLDEQLADDDGIAEVQETVGERTLALNDVRQLIQSLDATTELQDAVASNLLYLEDKDSETVLVENSIIERALADHESVNFRALNAEMDARGLLDGPAKRTSTPSISNITMWRIDREWAEPLEFVDGSDSLVMDHD